MIRDSSSLQRQVETNLSGDSAWSREEKNAQMKLAQIRHTLTPARLAAGAMGVLLAATLCAQVKTETETKAGQATHEVKVERAEVVYVTGNDLVVKMEDGQIRHIPNVPESARVNVEGKELGIHDLKPGMKLERTITTTTTPRTVTTVQTVTGKVWQVTPPTSVILTLEDGTNQRFKIPKGQKFTVNGQQTDAFGLKKGMMISATKVVEVPETVVEQQRQLTGTMPPPPPAPPADAPILVVEERRPPAAAPAAPAAPAAVASAEPAPTQLPKTASSTPLIGLLGLVSLGLALSLRIIRRFC
jgi:LPXTG-motif cell wall-anchored protein